MRSSMAPRRKLTISGYRDQCRYRPSVGGMGNKLDPILGFTPLELNLLVGHVTIRFLLTALAKSGMLESASSRWRSRLECHRRMAEEKTYTASISYDGFRIRIFNFESYSTAAGSRETTSAFRNIRLISG